MAPIEQLAQHPWLLVPALVIWLGLSAGRRWLTFLRDLREYRPGRCAQGARRTSAPARDSSGSGTAVVPRPDHQLGAQRPLDRTRFRSGRRPADQVQRRRRARERVAVAPGRHRWPPRSRYVRPHVPPEQLRRWSIPLAGVPSLEDARLHARTSSSRSTSGFAPSKPACSAEIWPATRRKMDLSTGPYPTM
jgi:hypothetical protein